MIVGTADDWLEALGADSLSEEVGIFSVADTVATGESRISETGDDLGLGILGASAAISIEGDRLKRKAKLERFDCELCVRAGGCLTREALGVTCCSEGVADEERDVSSCCPSDDGVVLFSFFSAKEIKQLCHRSWGVDTLKYRRPSLWDLLRSMSYSRCGQSQ